MILLKIIVFWLFIVGVLLLLTYIEYKIDGTAIKFKYYIQEHSMLGEITLLIFCFGMAVLFLIGLGFIAEWWFHL